MKSLLISDQIHHNSLALMKLGSKAGKLGYKGDFCQNVAYAMGEQGDDHPSDAAILYAENLIREMEKE